MTRIARAISSGVEIATDATIRFMNWSSKALHYRPFDDKTLWGKIGNCGISTGVRWIVSFVSIIITALFTVTGTISNYFRDINLDFKNRRVNKHYWK
jgi:hypothetical protein